MRHLQACAFLSLLFLPCFATASNDTNAKATNPLPSVSELDKLTFTPAKDASVSSVPYDQLSDVRGLFLAYRAGAAAVSRYRDPVLTRGGSGISVFKAAAPAVVAVVVGSVKDNKFNPDGLGTGAIIDGRGYVLTNWHVIEGHSDAVVFLKPSTTPELETAKALIGRVVYENSTADLALLKLVDARSPLPWIAVADMNEVQVAEDIHVIGHPHGNFWSYSTGVVSQIRDDYTWSYEDGSKHEAKVLQLQTAINPGNSGGPVLNDSGRILGLVAMSEEGQNLDYAIAADVIKRFLFTGMQMTTRGASNSAGAHPPAQRLYLSKTADGTEVSKSVYAEAVVYSIDGKVMGLVAMFNDGTEIKAWNKNPNGSFESWSAKFSDGKEYVGTAQAGALTRISAR